MNTDLTAAAHDRIWWALHDRCWRAWAIDHRPAIDPYTARQHAARVAADAVAEWVAEYLADTPRARLERRPPLMVALHEQVPWGCWSNPGLLAERLRRYADRLDAAATAEMLAAHSREAA